ncbi:hypothetical protein BC628DRAFT_1418069 [Trametes gibbosa]|nr:hypothetical protein BC628DRAFT_1418069 [Trametes gibbosa]
MIIPKTLDEFFLMQRHPNHNKTLFQDASDRTNYEHEQHPTRAASDSLDTHTMPSATTVTAATVRRDITAIVDTLFAERDVDDTADAFGDIPARHHSRLVDALVSGAVESHDDGRDAALVARVFSRVVFAGTVCAPSAWEAGFAPTAATMRELVLGEPRALGRFMCMFKATGLDRDGERAARVLLRLGEGC